MRFRNRHAHAVAESLAERAGGGFDARRQAALRVTWRNAAPLAELLDLLKRQIIAGDVQQAVEQRRTVAGRQDETVPVGPMRIDRIMPEKPCPQHIGHGRSAQGQPRMAAIGLLHRVNRQEAERLIDS